LEIKKGGIGIEFIYRCKVCGAPVEKEKILSHLKSHAPVNYYDVIPDLGWEKGDKKPKKGD